MDTAGRNLEIVQGQVFNKNLNFNYFHVPLGRMHTLRFYCKADHNFFILRLGHLHYSITRLQDISKRRTSLCGVPSKKENVHGHYEV